jgi:hypothetical protein
MEMNEAKSTNVFALRFVLSLHNIILPVPKKSVICIQLRIVDGGTGLYPVTVFLKCTRYMS